ncbi:peptidylprolyl isomerase [Paenibacillus sp. GCM10023252]|uniref:peptidylprolyl isomerase n=1 Tax=Paenibacillus sp. GCM10023252 TaxID=3252649 RepID=UPI0036D389E7
MLKGIVILQAVCMIVLAVFVIMKLMPAQDKLGPIGGGHTGEDEEPAGQQGSNESVSQLAAELEGGSVTMKELQDKLLEQYGGAVLRTMMLHRAIDQEAEAHGLQVDPKRLQDELTSMMEGYEDEDSFYAFMKDQLGFSPEDVREDIKYKLLLEQIAARSVQVTEEEVAEYRREHESEYGPKTQLGLEWIVTETKDEADQVLGLLADGEEFADVARSYSIDTYTKESGGSLGFVDEEDPFYAGELLDTASRLQTGEIAGPIATEDGYAIIRLAERRVTKGLQGTKLDDEIRRRLTLSKAQPLGQVEESLLNKYGARVIVPLP